MKREFYSPRTSDGLAMRAITALALAVAFVMTGTLLAGSGRAAPGKTSGASLPTGPQVIGRCRKAYDSLKSYQGTTEVHAVFRMGAVPHSYNTSASIKFVRPGKIYVTGTLMESGTFTFVSDGHATWELLSIGDSAKWRHAQNTEMAIASATGISQQAATTIPAVLIKTHWGYPVPFARPSTVSKQVAREAIAGHTTYRVSATTSQGRETYWVDSRTFLLVKMRTEVSSFSRQSGGQGSVPQDAKNGQPMMDTTQTFQNVVANARLPLSLFARPKGAPR